MTRMKVLMAAVALALAASVGWAAELRVATVDLDKVFNAHPRTKAAEAELKKQEDEVQAEMESIMAEGQALRDEVTKLRAAAKNQLLTEEARREKSIAADDKLNELQDFELRARRTQETKIKQMREQVLKSRQAIVDELMAAVTEFATAGEYDLVLDRSGQTMNAIPLVLYADPALDVTAQLIVFLEAKSGEGSKK